MIPARAANFFMLVVIVSLSSAPVLGGAILGPVTTLAVNNVQVTPHL